MDTRPKKKLKSHKNKSNWRQIDLNDVENFLSEQRDSEIAVGNVQELPNEKLFSIDLEPCTKPTQITSKQLRKLNAKNPAKCFDALKNRSKVEDPIVKRNTVKPKQNMKRKNQTNIGVKKMSSSSVRTTFNKNIWEEDDIPDEFKVEWYNKNLIQHNLRNLGNPIVKAPSEIHSARSKLQPVAEPHPGNSYNPTFEDHQELIGNIITKESQVIKQEKHLESVVTDKFSKYSRGAIRRMRQAELTEGFPMNESNGAQDEDELCDGDYSTINPPARNNKKDLRQRRKKLEEKQRLKAEKLRKTELKKIQDINKVKLFEKEISVKEQELQKKRKMNEVRQEEKQLSAGRIGRHKYKELEEDTNLLHDITGQLRTLKPTGNLLLDRFKSLQKRNILPSGMLRKPRRSKKTLKKYLKRSHKDVD